jgi:glutathione S-transferase
MQLVERNMTLTIYGSHRSRTMRVLWMAAELGLAYEHIPLKHNDPKLKQAAFLQINPTGTIPTIVDNDFAMSESLAINLYLSKMYGCTGPTPLYPGTIEGEANVWRWSLWANTHIEPWVQNDDIVEELRTAIDGTLQSVVEPAIRILNTALTSQPWLVGKHFTVGDINVAGVLSPSRAKKIDMNHYSQVCEWLKRCYSRPAAVRARTAFPD